MKRSEVSSPIRHRIGDESTFLIFMHMPKAAGMSLRQVIVRQYGEERVLVPQPVAGPALTRDWKYLRGDDSLAPRARPGYEPNSVPLRELANRTADELARVRVVLGHLWFGLHDALPRPATYMTVLRDPVERILSLFFYRKRTQGLSATLQQYLDSGRDWEIDNGQTRYLCGRVEGEDVRFTPCTPRMLDAAKAHLRDRFSVVGIAERFDESVLLMARTYGWDVPFYERYNVNRSRPRGRRVPESIRDRIAAANVFDAELYSYANRSLDEQLTAHSPPIDAAAVRGFRRSNLVHGSAILRALHPAAAPVLRAARSVRGIVQRRR